MAPATASKPVRFSPFPLRGPMTHEQFQQCWQAMTHREQVICRELADQHDMTLKDLLNRFEHLRPGNH